MRNIQKDGMRTMKLMKMDCVAAATSFSKYGDIHLKENYITIVLKATKKKIHFPTQI